MRLFFFLLMIASLEGADTLFGPQKNQSDFPFAPEQTLTTATDSSGNTITLWVEKEQVWASESVALGSWSMPTLLSSPQAKASSPQVEIASSGEAIAVWVEDNGLKSAVRSSLGHWRPSFISPASPALKEEPKPFEFSLSGHPLLRLKPTQEGDGKIRTESLTQHKINALSTNAIDAPTGKNLSGAQIGFAVGTSASTDGLIVSGVSAFGTSSFNNNVRIQITAKSASDIFLQRLQGTLNLDDGTRTALILTAATLSPTTTNRQVQGIILNDSFVAPMGNTISNAAELYTFPRMSNNIGTITNAYGVFVDVGTSGAGTITNAYGVYAAAPAFGGTKTALYADNGAIGYTATTPPTNGLIISGQVGVGTSAPTSSGLVDVQGLISGNGAIYGTLLRTNLYETGSATGTCELFVGGTHTINGSGTTNAVSWLQVSPTATATSTIGNSYGVQVMAGSGSGTITNAYGLYATAPGFGTNKAALYSDNGAIGYTGVTPPTNGLIVSGQVGIGISNVGSLRMAQIGGTIIGTPGSVQYGLYCSPSLCTNNVTVSATAYNIYVQPSYLNLGFGEFTNAYGIFVDSGSMGVGGAINNAYGMYATAPTFASTNTALYSDNVAVGYTATTPPTHGAIISGNSAMGTSSANPASQNNVRLYVAKGNMNVDLGYQVSLRSDRPTEASGGVWLGAPSSGTWSGHTVYNNANDAATPRATGFTTSSNDAITGVLTAGMTVYNIKGAVSIGTGYSLTKGPDNSLIVQSGVGVGVTSLTSGVVLQVAGTIAPAVSKVGDLGTSSLKWSTLYVGNTPAGSSRLAPSQTLCSSCNKIMMRGTGTFYILGEEADYISAFCIDCGNHKMEAISHLPKEKLALRRPPPQVVFLGFAISPNSGNSRVIQVHFSYGDRGEEKNSTWLSDAEYRDFLQMDKETQRSFLKDLGIREWYALEELRLMNEECDKLRVVLDEISQEWKGTDLLK